MTQTLHAHTAICLILSVTAVGDAAAATGSCIGGVCIGGTAPASGSKVELIAGISMEITWEACGGHVLSVTARHSYMTFGQSVNDTVLCISVNGSVESNAGPTSCLAGPPEKPPQVRIDVKSIDTGLLGVGWTRSRSSYDSVDEWDGMGGATFSYVKGTGAEEEFRTVTVQHVVAPSGGISGRMESVNVRLEQSGNRQSICGAATAAPSTATQGL